MIAALDSFSSATEKSNYQYQFITASLELEILIRASMLRHALSVNVIKNNTSYGK
jgi:hypothetical protein